VAFDQKYDVSNGDTQIRLETPTSANITVQVVLTGANHSRLTVTLNAGNESSGTHVTSLDTHTFSGKSGSTFLTSDKFRYRYAFIDVMVNSVTSGDIEIHQT